LVTGAIPVLEELEGVWSGLKLVMVETDLIRAWEMDSRVEMGPEGEGVGFGPFWLG
jgi:hypothetical protein